MELITDIPTQQSRKKKTAPIGSAGGRSGRKGQKTTPPFLFVEASFRRTFVDGLHCERNWRAF